MTRPLRIMIVEDDAIILMQLEMLLEDAGHVVVGRAMSAREAIRVADETRPELVLLDLKLRDGSSGIDVARALHSRTSLTIVFVTANAGRLAEDLEGAAAVIAKPFNERTLAISLAYLEECVHRPPPELSLPLGMRLAPAYVAHMDNLRSLGRNRSAR